jgi:membrane protein YqaA with SNARE-associated domain
MKRLMFWAQSVALASGGPGLLLAAFLDSSFLSLPEINDILVVWMVTRHKNQLLYYVSMATLGSIAGCLVIYWLAYKGGEAFARRRAGSAGIERRLATVRRYGLLAVLVPSMLPPPAPFKVFVILAGMVRIRPMSFIGAVCIGRGSRYLIEGFLAVRYGDMALRYVDEHGQAVGLAAALALLAIGLVVAWWQRRRPAEEQG